jgi:hypothetical protein
VSRALRQTAQVLALALFASYAYFYQAGGWNQNARYDLVRAIIERHTLQIDAYAENTGDKAEWQGHSYSDKAPGQSFLSVIPALAARQALRVVHIDPRGHRGVVFGSYVVTLATAGVFTVIAALVIFQLVIEWGFSRGAAIAAATAFGVASPAWAYATLFMGHAISSGTLMLAFAAASRLGSASTPASRGSLAWRVGFWIGIAVLVEFPAAIPAAFIVLLALWLVRRQPVSEVAGLAVRIVAAGLVFAAVLFAHNAIAFGSPFHVGYAAADSPLGRLNEGFFGITLPSATVMKELLIGQYRGLLPLAPILVVAPIGLAMLARTPTRRAAAISAAAVAAFYLAFNAAYHYWEGGWAYGPRQMMPAVPFLALGIAPVWDAWGRIGRVVLAAAWIWGAGVTLVAVSTSPQPDANIKAPVSEQMWPAFKEGDLAFNNQGFDDARADAGRLRHHPELHAGWNLGELAGLKGLTSLVPLGVMWILAGVALVRIGRKGGGAATPISPSV